MRNGWLVLGLCGLVACDGSIDTLTDDGGGGGDDDGGGGGPDGGPAPDAPICEQSTPIVATQQVATPDLLLVLDTSGSMNNTLATGDVKMDVMKAAVAQVFPTHDAEIRYGLFTYPTDNTTCGAGQLVSPVAANNAATVVADVNAITPGGATPTYLAIAAAGNAYASIPVNPDGRYVLLATDGLPNCLNGSTKSPSVDQSIAAIAALNAQGIKTFVIGFGDVAAADPSTLMAFAQAGGTGSYFAASSPAQLQTALDTISGSIAKISCSFELATVPADIGKVTVKLNGTIIVRDLSHGTGWDYDPATNTITFYGDTCQSVQSGAGGAIGVDFGCVGGPIIG